MTGDYIPAINSSNLGAFQPRDSHDLDAFAFRGDTPNKRDGNETGKCSPRNNGLEKEHLEELERRRTERELGVHLSSSESDDESSARSANGCLTLTKHPQLYGQKETSLPQIPTTIPTGLDDDFEDVGPSYENQASFYDNDFSFRPGDDTANLERTTSVKARRLLIEQHLLRNQRTRELVESKDNSSENPKQVSHNLQIYDSLNRNDSRSSVVTAIRDKSGRTSEGTDAQGSQHGSNPPRPKARKIESSEAVAAVCIPPSPPTQ